MKLPRFPDTPIPYLPYHVLLNSKYHRIVYFDKTKRVIEGMVFWVSEWRDWFTNEPLKNGDWIVQA